MRKRDKERMVKQLRKQGHWSPEGAVDDVERIVKRLREEERKGKRKEGGGKIPVG